MRKLTILAAGLAAFSLIALLLTSTRVAAGRGPDAANRPDRSGRTGGTRTDRTGRTGQPRADRTARTPRADRTARTPRAAMPADIPSLTIPLGDWHTIMTRELKLDANQQARLKTGIDEAIAALAAWDKENAAKLSDAQAEVDKVRLTFDAEQINKANEKLKAIQGAREKLEADQQARVLALLTPEQRTQWEGYKLYGGLLVVFAGANLSAAQKDQLRSLADSGARDIEKAAADAAAKAQDKAAGTASAKDQDKAAAVEAAKAQARRTLLNLAMAVVLTDAQRAALSGASATPRRERADRPARTGR